MTALVETDGTQGVCGLVPPLGLVPRGAHSSVAEHSKIDCCCCMLHVDALPPCQEPILAHAAHTVKTQ